MAYVNVAEWKPDQVTDWLKGLDNVIVPYIHSFLNNQVNGQQLLNLGPDDLEHLGVFKLGHQELILEAVELLRNFHYELDRETLQMLALRLSCLAHSLHNELSRNYTDATLVSTQTLADVANIAAAVQPLAGWLDRPPFSGQLDYCSRKSELLSLALEMATCAQRDRFAERPVEELRINSSKMAVLADSIIREIQDPLLLQPASLELVTLKKRSSDDLGFYIVPSFYGVHQIGALKLNSAAHQSGKLEPGDEIVQINYQTVVGWQVKQVMALFEESPTEVLLTIKKRPKHTKVYGQIYMKPYRLPSRKRAVQNSFARWTDNLPSPRPELFTIPQIQLPIAKSVSVESTVSGGPLPSSSEEEGEGLEGDGASSPTSARLYLPKPRLPVQRRATITGASPLSKRAPVNLQQFWEELKLEREWRGMGGGGEKPKVAQLIQDCESRVSGPRKYSSFDNLKERNTTCFLKDSKPDVVSSCQDRLKSTGSDDTFKSAETSERKSSCSDSTCVRKSSVGSDDGKCEDVSEKSTESDDVFKVVESYGRSSKKSTELTETFKDENDSLLKPRPTHVRNKSNDSDSVFVSDSDAVSEVSEGKVSSLKAKIEMFSKVTSETENPKPPVNRGIKPKVPLRTFRLPVAPEKPIPPKVEAKVVLPNETEDKSRQPVPSVPKERVQKERGKLDKSFSTPAYDFSPDMSVSEKINMLKQKFLADSKLETRSDSAFEDSKSDVESLSGKEEETKTNDNSITASIPSISEEFGDSEKEVHGQIVETINKHLLTLDYETDSEPKWKDKNTIANLDSENVIESEEKIGKILETINSSLAERRKEMERDSKVRKNSTEGADLSKTISQVCKEEILQTYNPSGFVLSKPTSLENISEPKIKGGVIPIPPRVRITPPTIQEERTGLPDVTITSPPPPPETPRRKPVSNLDSVDKPMQAPATFPRQKGESRRPVTPPEPPPRPTPPAPAVQPKGACYRAMMVAKSISKTAKVSSPRSLRKKNPLLAKHRNVTVKELGVCECEGWLQQRCRRGSGQWNRGWFIIKNTTFYGFRHKEAPKADVMISLPGFTVSDAEEVKSRRFAFKVYHTGTMFYFAADNHEEMTVWMDCITVATRTAHESHSASPLFSESEGEGSGEEGGSGSCFPSPKIKKIAGLLGSPSKPAPSSSNTSTLDKNSESGKKQFGSLKKQRGGGGGDGGEGGGGSSLDRKYLGFLGRGTAVPVPTAQFRSYRRVAPPLPRSHHQSAESVLTLDTSMSGFGEMPQRSPRGVPQVSPGLPTNQPLPPDMADYRLASLAKNKRRENQEQDTSGFVTLEALMLSRQEEERRNQQNILLNQPPPPPPPHPITQRVRPIPQESNVRPRVAPRGVPPSSAPLSQTHSRSTSAFTEERERESNVTIVRRSSFNTPSRLQRHLDLDNQNYRDGSPEKLWIDSLRRTDRRYPPTPRHIHQVHPTAGARLKKAALYQPPPVSPLDTPGGGEGMQLAFEMTLDQSEAKRRYQKGGPTPATRFKNLFTGRSDYNPSQKTLLGSPRLHRAIFRGSVTRTDSGGETVNSPPLSPPQEIMEIQVTNPTTPDYPGLEYPPVFEPGTYSLADASSVLRHRNREAR